MKKEKIEPKKLVEIVEKEAKKYPILIAVLKSKMGQVDLKKFSKTIAKDLKGTVIRSGYTPNSELSLFEIRRKGLVLVILIMHSDEERIMAIDPTTDDEIAEIESNIYSSNINDVYVRLVSDIF